MPRARSRIVTLRRGALGLIAIDTIIEPTAERIAQGDVEIAAGRARARSQVEQLAIAGELGEATASLLPAATWFGQIGEVAELRLLNGASERAQAARRVLARLYDVLGADALSVLIDVLVFDLPAAGRVPLLRSALHGLAAWRGRGGR